MLLLTALQLVSTFALNHGLATVNSLFLFGSVPGNATAISVALVFIILCLIFLWINKLKADLWAALLLAGAVSNLLERLRFGGVIDYLSIPNFFIFNAADVAIIVGLAGFSIGKFFIKK